MRPLLVLLAGLLTSSARRQSPAWRKLALDAVSRFSILGMVAVATLVVSGAINAWIIVRTWQVLLATAYGQILLVKIAVVALMVAFACVNRFWITPQLAAAVDTSRQLARNSGIEFALGLAVFAIVGALGLQHPMIHP